MAVLDPTTKTMLKLEPMLWYRLIAARPLMSVYVAACDPVASHDLSWLAVETRRDSQGNGGLGSGDLSDGWPDHPVLGFLSR